MAHTASTVLLCAIGDDVQLLALAILDNLGSNGSTLKQQERQPSQNPPRQ